jgi:hypothetical protein
MSNEMNEQKNEQPPMRTVMVAAPSYDGKVGVWHCAALTESIKIGMLNNINIMPIYVSFDALVQRARNDIFKIAHDIGVDDLVFVDTDVDWQPQDLFRLLNHDVDIVAAPVIKKNDNPTFSVKLLGEFKVEDNGLAVVDGVATGFMRIRKSAITKIWDAAEEYKELGKAEPSRMVFDVKLVDGDLWSEDIVFCDNWIRLGGKVYIDPLINCGHSGEKRWVGNFYEWIKLFNRR